MAKRITVILGHPDAGSLNAAMADAYVESARAEGHAVQLFRLGDIDFDPILRHGYAQRQPLEPGLQAVLDSITASDHLVFVYPTWWGGMPALLKGLFDRILLPGIAFKYRKNSPLWDRLLSGRSAQVFVTMDAPPWYDWLVNRMPGHHQIRRTILEFCGIRPVRIHSFGPVRTATAQRRARWLAQVRRAARRA